MCFAQEPLHVDEGVFPILCLVITQTLSIKEMLNQYNFTSEGNDMIMDTSFSCFWTDNRRG